jgi:uncharacterized protein YjbJ (UPF0337 family)
VNTDQVEGTVKKVAGRAQEAFGDLAGSVRHQAEGVSRQAAGRAQEAYGDGKEVARNLAAHAARVVERQPLMSLLVVGAAAFLLGLFASRR